MYRDLRGHLENLEQHGLLQRIKVPINKDTELHPLVRWQFRGLPEEERKAFLFEQVVDAQGRSYPIPVCVGAIAGSRQILCVGLDIEPNGLPAAWSRALANPIPPVEVTEAACQEVVLTGDDLTSSGGVGMLPIPISSPGWDIGPFITAGHFISKDPDSGVQNSGNYRGQVRAVDRIGMNASIELGQGIYQHWLKARERGENLPVAVVLGAPPAFAFSSIQKAPYDVDEASLAGALAGEALPVVRCKTVDLMVPADAEIIIEGWIDIEWLEAEAPFGESHGYVNLREWNHFMQVTAITHRKNPIYLSFISQVAPSESSCIRRAAYEPLLLDHLRNGLGLRFVRDVHLHEPLTGVRKVIVIQCDKAKPAEVWRALGGAATFRPAFGKLIVAVDTDIEPTNMDAVLWAISYRCHLGRDVSSHPTEVGHAPREGGRESGDDAMLLFNAMMKGPFPPVALPKKEYMERAREIWEELDLPPLKPQSPWHGYSLGHWSEELDILAERAARGEYMEIGEEIRQRRRRVGDVWPNDPHD